MCLESRGKERISKANTEASTKKAQENISPFKQNLEAFEEHLNQDHLKSAIRALNEKLKFYENIEQEKDIAKD